MLTGARWPNIKKDYDQADADFWHTWSSAHKLADGSYEDKGGLEELSVSVEGATAYIKGKGAAVLDECGICNGNGYFDECGVNS